MHGYGIKLFGIYYLRKLFWNTNYKKPFYSKLASKDMSNDISIATIKLCDIYFFNFTGAL